MQQTTEPLPFAPGDEIHGFRILAVTPLPELRCTAVQAQHLNSRARLLHLVGNDTENLFAAAFRTPPGDDTGVPHILEHSVLGGSRKYPVKDPFVEMLKRSMATFINAFTYSDKTVYPVSSNVKNDFFNLVDVYMDAVFHPNITAMTLKQEGHHLEPAEPGRTDSPLTIKGIVYNEMKGAYSELDSIIERETSQGLFPDTTYGRDSGGDPKAIPALTFKKFRDFYSRFYQPANAYLMIYGNIPTVEHLAFLDARLREFPQTVGDPETGIGRQPRWTKPQEKVQRYAIGPDEAPENKAAFTLNWVVGDATDPVQDLAFEVVDRLLVGDAAAPLYKALIDSRYGEDLTPSGYSSGTLETTFHVGLKGAGLRRKQAIHKLVFKVLQDCVKNGFPPDRVAAAFRQLEFEQREISSMYPLRLMNWVYNAWIYDLDPLLYLQVTRHLDELRRRYQADPAYFTRLIQKHLVDNPHRLDVSFKPDPQLQSREEAKFTAAMARRKERLGAEKVETIAREARELEALQNTPNSPEALNTLPSLKKSDLPASVKIIPTTVMTLSSGIPLLRNDVFANGINYWILAFDLAGLPAELQEYVPLFTDVLTRVGTDRFTYVQMAERIAAATGGLNSDPFLAADALTPNRFKACLTLGCKALDSTAAEALQIMRELLLELDLADTERLRDIILQNKARRQSGIISGGHRFAAMHAARGLSPLAGLSHIWDGLPQVRLAARLAREFDAVIPELRAHFAAIRRFILDRRRLTVSFTGSPQVVDLTVKWLENLAPALPVAAGPIAETGWPVVNSAETGEGLALAAEVAFCARCLPAPHSSAPTAMALGVFSNLLSLGYLWEEVRIKGGAYGGLCAYDSGGQVFEMMSYRDPNIPRTLDIFATVGAHLKEQRWSEAEIERAIISCAKSEERPLRPGPVTSAALGRYLSRGSDAVRQERYERLLKIRPEDVQAAALDLFRQDAAAGTVCVLSGRPLLETANRRLQPPLALQNVLDEAMDLAAAPEDDEEEAE